jgi:AraC-like DNA-binding protein
MAGDCVMPHSVITSFGDPYEYQGAIRAGTVQLLVTERGKYSAELTQIDLQQLWLQRGQESLARVGHSAVTKNRCPIFFLSDHQQAAVRNSGTELSPGHIMFYALDSEHHHQSSAGCRWGTMSLAPDDLAAVGRAIAGCDLTAPAENRLIRPPPHLMSRLLGLHEAAGRLAATVPDTLAHPEVARAMEQELVRVMVGCLTDGMNIGTRSHRHARIPVMQRFERLLAENPDSPLYLSEICAAIGASARTLRCQCQEHLGMSPHRYLWLRRMNLVRRALAQADPAVTSVTQLATGHGFWELGRFSVEYRRLFGESPSATQRREPGHRQAVPSRQIGSVIAEFA